MERESRDVSAGRPTGWHGGMVEEQESHSPLQRPLTEVFNASALRDEVDDLPEDGVYCLRCFWWFLFLHNHVGYRITPPVATLNIHPIANAVSEWDANETFYKNILEKL